MHSTFQISFDMKEAPNSKSKYFMGREDILYPMRQAPHWGKPPLAQIQTLKN